MIKNYFKTAWRNHLEKQNIFCHKHFWFIGWCCCFFADHKLSPV